MLFIDKLEWLMRREGLNKHTLAQKCGVPYTTIVGLYERGVENARLSTLNRLSSFFNVALDYLVIDDFEHPEDFIPNGNKANITCENSVEEEAIVLLRTLNASSQAIIISTLRGFAGNPNMCKETSEESKRQLMVNDIEDIIASGKSEEMNA